MNLFKVFYANDDENEIISTLFYIHKDLDACLIRTAADISQTIDQKPCITKVGIQQSVDHSSNVFVIKNFFRIWIFHPTTALDAGIPDGEAIPKMENGPQTWN